jgi:putative nucleotidyltransferase with HDIG domain
VTRYSRRKEPAKGVVGALSTPPAHAWPEGVVYHGARALLLVALAAFTTLLFPPEASLRVARYEVGMVASDEVQSRVRFDVPLTPVELERARSEARASVPPTFNARPQAADTMAVRLLGFFESLDEAAASADAEARIEQVLASRSIEPTASQIALLQGPDTRTLLRRTALRAAEELLAGGVADAADLSDVTTDRIVVREVVSGAEVERSIPRDDVVSNRELLSRAVGLLPLSVSPDVQDLLRLILIQHLEYTYELNVPITEIDRERAARAVPTTKRSVLEGEAIVRENEQITPSTLEALNAYEDELRQRGLLEDEGVRPLPWLGSGLRNLLVLGVLGLLVMFFRPSVYANPRWLLLLAALTAVYIAAAALIASRAWAVETLPIAFAALSVAVLWDGRLAAMLALTLAVLTGQQYGFDAQYVTLTVLMGGAAAALSVRAVRRRAQTWIFIAIIIAAYAGAILAHGLLVSRDPSEAALALAWAAANAVFSAIIAMGFVPVFEWFTDITTDQTLLEWADPNRSLLKRLSMEAPGTYAHTINVANLAEAAATAIGADGLLCRVGLYYHDVGKMLKPHFFVENQPDGRNPHDRLKPEMSAAIIREHVVEGRRMANEAKVPHVVSDFIGEHHGTQRIGFFYDKAVEEYGADSVDVADFMYPGPKPQSRETAIAMLADSVESATRAIKEPTPERIRELINSIVETKIADAQLDEAPLTLAEIALIKDQFVKVLSGVYHHRIDYPQTRHLTRSQAAPVAQPQAAAQPPAAQPEVAEPKAAAPKAPAAQPKAADAPAAPEPDPIDLFTDVDGAEPEGDGADDRGDNA